MRVPCVPNGRQVGRHHHGGDVAGAQRLAADVDAEPLQHRLQRLLGERDVVERIAGAVEADHEAVADELVLAHALDVGEILDARRRRHAIGPVRHGSRRRRSTRSGPRPPRQTHDATSASHCSPMRSDCTTTMRTPCQRAADQVTEMSRDYFPAARRRRGGVPAARAADFAGHLPAINHTGQPWPVSGTLPRAGREASRACASSDRTPPHGSRRRPRRARAASGGFSRRPRATRRKRRAPAASLRTIGGIDALIALQGQDDPAERRRRAVKRGRTALDVLDELKIEAARRHARPLDPDAAEVGHRRPARCLRRRRARLGAGRDRASRRGRNRQDEPAAVAAFHPKTRRFISHIRLPLFRACPVTCRVTISSPREQGGSCE